MGGNSKDLLLGAKIGSFRTASESAGSDQCRLVPTFALHEDHFDRPWTCRNIVDMKVGKQNLAAGSEWTHVPCDVDCVMVMERELQQVHPQDPLQGCCSDFESAFRQETAWLAHSNLFVNVQ